MVFSRNIVLLHAESGLGLGTGTIHVTVLLIL